MRHFGLSLSLLVILAGVPPSVTRAQLFWPIEKWLVGERSGASIDANLRMHTFSVAFLDDHSCQGTFHEGGTGPGSGVSHPFSCTWSVLGFDTIEVEGR